MRHREGGGKAIITHFIRGEDGGGLTHAAPNNHRYVERGDDILSDGGGGTNDYLVHVLQCDRKNRAVSHSITQVRFMGPLCPLLTLPCRPGR
jgi:hypothetical protein